MSELADLSSTAFWALPDAERDAALAELRRTAPVSRQRRPDPELIPPQAGIGEYWAVVRHADVRAVSRDARAFRTERDELFDGVPGELAGAVRSFLDVDAPRHRRVRGLFNAALAPARVAEIERESREHARAIVDDLAPRGDGDFVADVATRLVAAPHAALRAALEAAEVDGARLRPDEVEAFFVLLGIAGDDSTRNTASHALRALTRFPDQRRALLDDLPGRIGPAVEEFVRWATPVMAFRRFVARDAELAGRRIPAGDVLLLFYVSANRDESAFERPERFDVLRAPNRHVGFGGGGPHHCLGAPVARIRLRALFCELLTRLPDIEAGEPERSVGRFANSIARLPCRFTPAPASATTSTT